MSEFINNTAKRQEKLKQIIKSLHQGTSVEDAKKEFKKHFSEVSTAEITQMEQSLIKEGMKIEEVQSLCDVHAAVFDGSISDIHAIKDSSATLGHPVQVCRQENDQIIKLIDAEIEPYLKTGGDTAQLMLRVAYDRLKQIHNHYTRKEMLYFPMLEKKGITAPPKVMWGIHDEIRKEIKLITFELGAKDCNEKAVLKMIENNIYRIKDMVTKENNILLPLLVENLTLYDWILIDEGTKEIGYFLEAPKHSFSPNKPAIKINPISDKDLGKLGVSLGSGNLSPIEISGILNSLPFDITFVDKDGYVKYFSQGKERIFDRPSTIIGRHVSMCHPPSSVHIVEEIVESFVSGRKDNEDFWIRMKDMFVYIRYFAVRDKDENYLGTLEVTQNIKPITELKGEKRLVEK